MKFLFVSTMNIVPWGGSEELWCQAANSLRDRNHDVTASVAGWSQLPPKLSALAEAGAKLSFRRPPPSRLLVRGWKKIRQLLGITEREKALIKEFVPDLVVISQGGIWDGLFWMKLCMEANLPFTIISQCNNEQWWPDDMLRTDLAGAYARAEKVFCVSHRNLELLRNQLGEALPQAEVVWNPFNVPLDQPPVWPSSDEGFNFACVARLQIDAKGQDLIFRVLALPQWRERPVRLNLYGTGPHQDGLRRLAESLQLDNVRFCGQVADIRAVWSQNHLLVLPSRYEGLPLALVEAMWCARPAVVTDIGGNSEVCLDEETGFVVPAPDWKLLERTLDRAWECRYQWEDMGRAARLRAERLISQNPARDFSQRLLDQVAARNGKAS